MNRFNLHWTAGLLMWAGLLTGGAYAQNVPPPTIDQEGTEAAWDITHPGWRQWRNQSNQAANSSQAVQPNQLNQAEMQALRKKQAEQQRLLEEARKKQQEEEKRRRELEQYWQQVMNQQRQAQVQQQQQAAERQRAFEKAKQTLLMNFRIPPVSVDKPDTLALDSANTAAWSTPSGMAFGEPAGATQGPTSGLSPQQWQRARQYRAMIETLHASPDRLQEDEEILARIEAGRNALWTKAVSVPDLPDDAREALALALPIVEPKGLTPRLSREDLQRLETAAQDVREVSQKTAMTLLDGIDKLANTYIPEGGSASSIKQYGAMLNVIKIAMAAEKGGASSAMAEFVDFAVGTLPFPQAKVAVAGGRLYANVAFQASNRFMTDAMAATESTFDSDTFWKDFQNDMTVWQKAVMEFVRYGPKH